MQKKNDEEKYSLYKTVNDLLHPSISKRNISNYRIVLDEDIIPVRVSYPRKVSEIKDVAIFFHGDSNVTNTKSNYSDILTVFSKSFDKLTICIDYDENDSVKKIIDECYKTYKFIYDRLVMNNIKDSNILLVGDSTASCIIDNIIKKGETNINKIILFYPVLSGEYYGVTKYNSILDNNKIDYDLISKLNKYYSGSDKGIFPLNNNLQYPSTLVICGNVDPLIDENICFSEKNDNINLIKIGFASHGFLNSNDKEIIKEYESSINKFLSSK